MARHVKVVTGEAVNGDTEAGNGLAKAVSDVVASASAYTITAVRMGQNTAVIITYDD